MLLFKYLKKPTFKNKSVAIDAVIAAVEIGKSALFSLKVTWKY